MIHPFRDKTDVFFDLDHTLWDFERNSALAFEQVLDELQLPFSIDDFLKFYVDINAVYWDKYSLNQISQEELRVGRIRDTFKELDYTVTTTEQLKVGDMYLSYLPNYNYLFDGAIDILDYLQESYHLHIITNGFNEVQNKKLINAGIYDYFKTITNSENAGVKKPDPQIFHYALAQAKVPVDRTVMVGDNLLADIQGARGVGMDSIYYHPQDWIEDKTIVQVRDLLDIKNLL